MKLQGEIAQGIAQQVRVQLTPQQQARLGSARAVNPAAYEAYLKGRFYQSTSAATPKRIKNAQDYFEKAIQQDSGFALAYVGLADCYESLAAHPYSPNADSSSPKLDIDVFIHAWLVSETETPAGIKDCQLKITHCGRFSPDSGTNSGRLREVVHQHGTKRKAICGIPTLKEYESAFLN